MSETPETLSDKLAAVRYQAPAVRPICQTINCGKPIMQGSSRCEDCAGGIDDLTRYLQLQDNLARAKAMRPSLSERLFDAWDFFRVIVWPRISHAAIGLLIIVITALALIAGCAWSQSTASTHITSEASR